jgi:hypothetical protein
MPSILYNENIAVCTVRSCLFYPFRAVYLNLFLIIIKRKYFAILDTVFSLDYSLTTETRPTQSVNNMYEHLVTVLVPSLIEIGKKFETFKNDSRFSVNYLNTIFYILSIISIEKLLGLGLLKFILNDLIQKLECGEMCARVSYSFYFCQLRGLIAGRL